MQAGDSDDRQALERAAGGDATGWQQFLARHHARLRRMVGLRLDPRLRGRVDPSDVLQEAYIEATRSLNKFLQKDDEQVAPFLWLRQLAGTRLAKAHRQHLGAQARDVRKELPLHGMHFPGVSSVILAEDLLARSDDPGRKIAKADLRDKVMQALESLDEQDREVLALRHFEHLTGAETAAWLGITPAAAAKRYLRALERLKECAAELPGGLESLTS
jgi:RNA polymerase sigma-70 factor (ECF subfamily)